MNKLAATESLEKVKQQKKKEKITLEGWLLYFLLFMVMIGLPAISTICILTAASSNYVP